MLVILSVLIGTQSASAQEGTMCVALAPVENAVGFAYDSDSALKDHCEISNCDETIKARANDTGKALSEALGRLHDLLNNCQH
jgi:hypothetical protein